MPELSGDRLHGKSHAAANCGRLASGGSPFIQPAQQDSPTPLGLGSHSGQECLEQEFAAAAR